MNNSCRNLAPTLLVLATLPAQAAVYTVGPAGTIIVGSGSVAALVYDNILHGVDANASMDGLVASEHNLVGGDPRFVAPASFDYSLRGTGSPAVNAGSTTLVVGASDVDGADRVQDAVVDIGAYESSDRVFATRFDP